MPYPTLTFTQWKQRRDALIAQGKVTEALALSTTHQIMGVDGRTLNNPTAGEPDAPAQGGSAPAGERFDRQAAVRERATRLIEQGVSVEQAERNAARAIAYERGEDVDLESMSLAELREHVKTFDPSVLRAGRAETHVFDDENTLSNEDLQAQMRPCARRTRPSRRRRTSGPRACTSGCRHGLLPSRHVSPPSR